MLPSLNVCQLSNNCLLTDLFSLAGCHHQELRVHVCLVCCLCPAPAAEPVTEPGMSWCKCRHLFPFSIRDPVFFLREDTSTPTALQCQRPLQGAGRNAEDAAVSSKYRNAAFVCLYAYICPASKQVVHILEHPKQRMPRSGPHLSHHRLKMFGLRCCR